MALSEGRKRRMREYYREWTVRWRRAAHAALGGRCGRCGFSDERALQIDHVYGDGAKESRNEKKGTFYKRVIAQAESGRYQLLCANCNWIKRVENAEVPRLA